MTMTCRLIAALAMANAAVLPACSSSSSSAPPGDGGGAATGDAGNPVEGGGAGDAGSDGPTGPPPGGCIFTGSTWNCGTDGTYGECPGSGSPTLGQACTYDGGCFFCYAGSGQSFTCAAGDWTFGNASGDTCTP